MLFFRKQFSNGSGIEIQRPGNVAQPSGDLANFERKRKHGPDREKLIFTPFFLSRPTPLSVEELEHGPVLVATF